MGSNSTTPTGLGMISLLPHHTLVIGCLNWIANSIGNEAVNQLKQQFHSFDGQMGQLRCFQMSLHHLVEYNPDVHDDKLIGLRVDLPKFRESLETIVTSYMLGVVDLKNLKLPPDSTHIYTFNGISLDNSEVTSLLFQYYRKIASDMYTNILKYIWHDTTNSRLCHQCIQEVVLDYVFGQKDLLQLVERSSHEPAQYSPIKEAEAEAEAKADVDVDADADAYIEPQVDIVVPQVPHGAMSSDDEGSQRNASGSACSDMEEVEAPASHQRPPLLQFGMPFLHRINAACTSHDPPKKPRHKKCVAKPVKNLKRS